MHINDKLPVVPQDGLMEGDGDQPRNHTGIRKESLIFHASAWKRVFLLFFAFVGLAGFGLVAAGEAFPFYVRIAAIALALACLSMIPRFLSGSRFRLTIDETGIGQRLPFGEFFVPWEAAKSASSIKYPSMNGGYGQPMVRIRIVPNATQQCYVTAKGDRWALADRDDPHLDIVGDLWKISPTQLAELINARLELR